MTMETCSALDPWPDDLREQVLALLPPPPRGRGDLPARPAHRRGGRRRGRGHDRSSTGRRTWSSRRGRRSSTTSATALLRHPPARAARVGRRAHRPARSSPTCARATSPPEARRAPGQHARRAVARRPGRTAGGARPRRRRHRVGGRRRGSAGPGLGHRPGQLPARRGRAASPGPAEPRRRRPAGGLAGTVVEPTSRPAPRAPALQPRPAGRRRAARPSRPATSTTCSPGTATCPARTCWPHSPSSPPLVARALAPYGVIEVVASGGGVHNPALMAALRHRLGGAQLVTSDELGIPVDGKEVVMWALLGFLTWHGVPGTTRPPGAEVAACSAGSPRASTRSGCQAAARTPTTGGRDAPRRWCREQHLCQPDHVRPPAGTPGRVVVLSVSDRYSREDWWSSPRRHLGLQGGDHAEQQPRVPPLGGVQRAGRTPTATRPTPATAAPTPVTATPPPGAPVRPARRPQVPVATRG